MHNKTTQILSSFIVAGLMLYALTPLAFAEENRTSTQSGTTNSNLGIQGLIQDVNNLQKEASTAAARKQKNLSEIISRADTLIANRLTELNKTLTRIQDDKRLTDSQKSNLTSQIQTTITGLNTLKTKIDADTDATVAMTDAKQIFSNFRVYEMLQPKINLLIMLNNIQTVMTNLQTLIPQLQTLVSTFQSQGKDVTTLNTLVTDMNTQITTINTALTTDMATIQAIDINTTNPQTAFQQVRSDIENTVKTGFEKIRTDIQQMRSEFKKLIVPNTESSQSPGPTSTTSANPQ